VLDVDVLDKFTIVELMDVSIISEFVLGVLDVDVLDKFTIAELMEVSIILEFVSDSEMLLNDLEVLDRSDNGISVCVELREVCIISDFVSVLF